MNSTTDKIDKGVYLLKIEDGKRFLLNGMKFIINNIWVPPLESNDYKRGEK